MHIDYMQVHGYCASNMMEGLNNCDSEVYPIAEKFLQFLAGLPIGAVTTEQSFSFLWRLKI